jgi:hypothetical protein
MSFVADAPGEVGSPVADLFHTVGEVQFALGLGVLVSGVLLAMRGFDVRTWGNIVLGLGLVSIAALLVILAQGTFAVIFLSIPGLLAIVAGAMARRATTG